MTKTRCFPLAALLGLLALAGCRSAHTTSAILYIEEQQYQKAVDVIHEGFLYSENEPDAFYWLGEAYSKLAEEAVKDNNYLEAKRLFGLAYESYKRAEETDPAGFTEMVETATLHNYTMRKIEATQDYQQDFYEQAEGHFRLAYAALPDSIAPIQNIATMKIQQAVTADDEAKRTAYFNEALELLDQVLADKPDAYLLKADKAQVLTQLGRNAEAQAMYDVLLAEHGDDPDLLKDIAGLALRQGDYGRAADLYLQTADIYTNDIDSTNDDQIKELLEDAGNWYGLRTVERYADALVALNRAQEMEPVPTEELLLTRLQTYYQYGRSLKDEAAAAGTTVDPALQAQANEQFQRGVEIGNALTQYYPAAADGFLFLSLCQLELGDFNAAQLNQKKYEELGSGGATP